MADKLIEKLRLIPYPKGQVCSSKLFFKEVYRSSLPVKPLSDERDDRCAFSTIYMLAKKGEPGTWHRLKSDESFFYHRGNSLRLAIIDPDGKLHLVIVGDELIDEEAVYHYTVCANYWFNFILSEKGDDDYGLFGVGVSPGFDMADTTSVEPEEMAREYPEYEKIIKEFAT